MLNIVVVSGGFDPLHSGHIEYFKAAKKHGDKLVVALNSDDWLNKKKGKYFMTFNERKVIISNLKMVDDVIGFDDDKHGSASLALMKIKKMHPNENIIFCNGGDRNRENTYEMKIPDIKFVFSVGGDNKINSSSWIMNDYEKR